MANLNLSRLKQTHIIFPLVVIIVFAVIIGIIIINNEQKDKKFSNLPTIQKDIQAKITSTPGYTISLLQSGATLSGNSTPAGSFQGDYKVKNTTAYTITKTAATTYVKKPSDKSYQKDDKTFAYQLNIIANPNWIQLTKRLDDKTINNQTYLQYDVTFEKPGQAVVKTMSQAQLDSLRITGMVLVNKQTFALYQSQLHQGKDTKNVITTNYTALAQAPVITIPQ